MHHSAQILECQDCSGQQIISDNSSCHGLTSVLENSETSVKCGTIHIILSENQFVISQSHPSDM